MFIEIVVLFLVFLIMIIGLIGEVLPAVPGMILIWLAALAYALYAGLSEISIFTILILIFLWLLASVIDYLAAYFTARHLNISWYGLGGAVLGAIICFVASFFIGLASLSVLLLLLGATIGGFVGEYYYQRHALKALKISGGIVLGYIIGTTLKIFLATLMILIFIIALIF